MDNINNISIKPKDKCSGCTLCVNICPKGAISMRPDDLGFLYPVVDVNLCVNCGLCLRRCPFESPQNPNEGQKYYALRHKENEQLLRSQSGAAFFILSEFILGKHGVIYGAAFDKLFDVIHLRASDNESLEELRYSKYTQSRLGDCFNLVLEDLKNGKYVLFTGTPCQNAGLKEFIPSKLSKRLFLVDLICHGVPSPKVWHDYVSYITKKYGHINKVFFRDKRRGWNVQEETFQCKKEYSFITFKKLFYKNICLRNSCYKCPFTTYNRVSDITIGDFWGWEKISSDFNDNKGVSLVITNTEKGNILLKSSVKDNICIEVKRESCTQPQLLGPTEYNNSRSLFEKEYSEKGFKYCASKYSDLNIKMQIKYKLLKIKHRFLTYLK